MIPPVYVEVGTRSVWFSPFTVVLPRLISIDPLSTAPAKVSPDEKVCVTCPGETHGEPASVAGGAGRGGGAGAGGGGAKVRRDEKVCVAGPGETHGEPASVAGAAAQAVACVSAVGRLMPTMSYVSTVGSPNAYSRRNEATRQLRIRR